MKVPSSNFDALNPSKLMTKALRDVILVMSRRASLTKLLPERSNTSRFGPVIDQKRLSKSKRKEQRGVNNPSSQFRIAGIIQIQLSHSRSGVVAHDAFPATTVSAATPRWKRRPARAVDGGLDVEQRIPLFFQAPHATTPHHHQQQPSPPHAP
ncbi:hypothetical protein BT93_B0303 [Corymbia citriodora subsp. variegata]|nr:hypothetical protein BT93_B0303 [Corymbia citriodora subsp. variegata]